MSKTKVCKKCKLFVEADLCPICKKDSFTTSFQGRIAFINTKESRIAKELGVDAPGEYAIKVR
jgi:DNA-directed RNA polymerase subunit E"